MPICSVPGCHKDKSAKRKHRYPVFEEEVFAIWIKRVANPKFNIPGEEDDERDKRIYNSYFVCDNHFDEQCKNAGSSRLKPYSLPTIDLPGFTGEPTLENSFLLPGTNTLMPDEEPGETPTTSAELPQVEQQEQSISIMDHTYNARKRKIEEPRVSVEHCTPVDSGCSALEEKKSLRDIASTSRSATPVQPDMDEKIKTPTTSSTKRSMLEGGMRGKRGKTPESASSSRSATPTERTALKQKALQVLETINQPDLPVGKYEHFGKFIVETMRSMTDATAKKFKRRILEVMLEFEEDE